MIGLPIVLLILLGLVALIDAKFKEVPSVFLTIIIFATAMVHFTSFETGMISLAFGIFGLLFGYLLYEADFIGGIADVKVMIIIGLMIPFIQTFFAFMLITVLFGMAYKLLFIYGLGYKETDYIPFLPCLYAVYVTLYLIGGIV